MPLSTFIDSYEGLAVAEKKPEVSITLVGEFQWGDGEEEEEEEGEEEEEK